MHLQSSESEGDIYMLLSLTHTTKVNFAVIVVFSLFKFTPTDYKQTKASKQKSH